MPAIFMTRALLDAVQADTEIKDYFDVNNLWDKLESDALEQMKIDQKSDMIRWWYNAKQTEQFIRARGTTIIMNNSYQIFNPLTGQHMQYLDRQDAINAMNLISSQILARFCPTVNQSISNDVGDVAWTPLETSFTVSATILPKVMQT